MNNYFRLLLVTCLGVGLSQAYSSGAPESACNDLIPQGHVDSYRSALHRSAAGPYKLSVPRTAVTGEMTAFTLSGGRTPFRGFIVRVLDSKTGLGAGEFVSPRQSDYSPMTCSQPDDTATHSNGKQSKSSVTLHWRAPREEGIYLVMGTIVESLEHSFVGYKAAIAVLSPNRYYNQK